MFQAELFAEPLHPYERRHAFPQRDDPVWALDRQHGMVAPQRVPGEAVAIKDFCSVIEAIARQHWSATPRG